MNGLTRFKSGFLTIGLMVIALLWVNFADAAPKTDKSDLNSDQVVDLVDLTIFSTNYLERNWESVDWCLFYNSTVAKEDFEGQSTTYYLKHFKLLLAFINDYFRCDADPDPDPDMLTLENDPKFLVRIARSTDGSGDYYITDTKVGSLFIYDSGMVLKAEIKGLDKPLGVVVDSLGLILVGNDGRDNIEVFDPSNGNMVALFGEGLLQMPTAITVGPEGNIFVTDSEKDTVLVFDSGYNYLRSIGSAGQGDKELNFPVDTEIITSIDGGVQVHEVFVADQGNHRIQIFDMQGNPLGAINARMCGFTCKPPTLIRLQGLSVDSQGRLHALDLFESLVSIFDPANGALLGSYGEYGSGPGFLKVPMDVLISDADKTIITTGDGDRIEVLNIP